MSTLSKRLEYRGWEIEPAYVGWSATHPDFDASWEGEEDGWVGNGLCVHGMTIEQVKAEVDEKIEEAGHSPDRPTRQEE